MARRRFKSAGEQIKVLGRKNIETASEHRLKRPTRGVRKYLMWLCNCVTLPPWPTVANQKFRVGVPHKTKAHAIAKPAKNTRKLKQKQMLEKTVLNLRSQEVSRELAAKSAYMTFVG